MNQTRRAVRFNAVAALAFLAACAPALGAEQSVESVAERSGARLAVSWVELRPGQRSASGFALARDGTLSHAGKALQPSIEVADSKGRPNNNPSSVRISPLSPSGKFALLTACESDASPSNLCWFQYLAEIPGGKLHKVAWAKYPAPAHVWWAKDESYAVIPVGDDGEIWLAALDLVKRESVDFHFQDAVRAAAQSMRCAPVEDAFSIDLDSLRWVGNHEIGLSLVFKCGRPPKNQVVPAAVVLNSGAIRTSAPGVPREPGAATTQAPSPSFDCAKASSAVEKRICADADLARLDSALVAAYRQAMAQSGDSDALKAGQLNWLRQVRNQCAANDCLAEAYRQRIAELSQGSAAPALPSPSPFPATYKGGFTGRETLTFSADGRFSEGGAPSGTYQVDRESPWTDARYPIVLMQKADGQVQKRHCKVQPDMRKMICNEGGTASSEFDRLDPVPAIRLPAAKKCDEEQLYLDVMAAARKLRPDLELRGATDISLDAGGKCRISLYYLKDGKAVDVNATYDLNRRPVSLTVLR